MKKIILWLSTCEWILLVDSAAADDTWPKSPEIGFGQLVYLVSNLATSDEEFALSYLRKGIDQRPSTDSELKEMVKYMVYVANDMQARFQDSGVLTEACRKSADREAKYKALRKYDRLWEDAVKEHYEKRSKEMSDRASTMLTEVVINLRREMHYTPSADHPSALELLKSICAGVN